MIAAMEHRGFARGLLLVALIAAASLALLAWPGGARAQTSACPTAAGGGETVCNLDETNDAAFGQTARTGANAFTVGDSSDTLILDAVHIHMTDIKGAQTLSVSIREDNSGAPGTEVAALPDAMLTENRDGEIVVITATDTITLTGSTTYFLQVETKAQASFAGTTSSTTSLADFGWSIGRRQTLGSDGTTWTAQTDSYLFALVASPPPLPSKCPTASDAQESVCNLDEASNPFFLTISGGTSLANAFTTGGTSSDSFTVNAVRIVVEATKNSSASTFTLSIRENNGGVPGTTAVGTLNGPTTATAPNDGSDPVTLDYTATGVTLTGATTYFLHFDHTSNDINLLSTTSTDEEGSSGWSIADLWTSTNSAGTWTSSTGNDAWQFGIVATKGAGTPTTPTLPALTIASAGDATEGADDSLDFTVTPSSAFGAQTEVTVTLTGADDFVAEDGRTQILFFPANDATALTAVFGITDDAVDDTDATATATITPDATAFTLASGGTATAMITDDDEPAATPVVVSNVMATEGDAQLALTWDVSGTPDPLGQMNLCALPSSMNWPPSNTNSCAGVAVGTERESASSTTDISLAASARMGTITGLMNGTAYIVGVRFGDSGGEVTDWVRMDGTATPMAAGFTPNSDNSDGRLHSFAVYEGADTSGTELALTPAFTTGTVTYSVPRPAAGVTQITIEFQTFSSTTRTFVAFTNGGSPANISGVSNGAGTHTFTLPTVTTSYFLALDYARGDGNPGDGARLNFPAAAATPTAGVTATPTTLTIAEPAGTGTYTLVLDTDPGEQVTVTPGGVANTLATFNPTVLTFTSSGATIWSTAQTITVTAVDDSVDNAGDQRTGTITHTVFATTEYSALGAAAIDSVALTVTDDDAAATPTTPPDPTIGTVIEGDESITVNWTAGTGTPAATGFDVCAILDSVTDFPSVLSGCAGSNTAGPGDTSAFIGDLMNGTAYKVAVRAYNANGIGDWVEATGTYTPMAPAPATPSGCPTTMGEQVQACNLQLTAEGSRASVGHTQTGSSSAQRTAANAFTTGGAANGYELTSVSLAYFNTAGSPGALSVAIHAEASGGGPAASAHATLTGTSPSGGAGVFAYTASGTVTLEADTTYFVVLSAPSAPTGVDNLYRFDRAMGTTEFAATGWSLADRPYYSSNGGSSYTLQTSGGPLRFAVVATPAATLPVLTIAAVGDATEGTNATLDFTLTPSSAFGAQTEVTVTLTGADAFVDFGSRALLVTFAASSAAVQTVMFPITNDATDEPDATATATITPNAAAFTRAGNGRVTARILDDDEPAVTFTCPATTGTQQTVCNLGEDNAGDSGVGSGLDLFGVRTNAFTTGSTANGYDLNAVHIAFNATASDVSASSIVVDIFAADASGTTASGESLGRLTGEARPSAAGTQVYSAPASGIRLDADTTYHLAVDHEGSNDGHFNIAFTNSNDEDGSAGWSIGRGRAGGSATFPVPGTPLAPLQFAVLATPATAPVESDDSSLSALMLSGVTLDSAFAPATQTYTASVANDVATTTVTATPTDTTGASVTEIMLDGTAITGTAVTLAVGANVITIEVTAEDDSTSTYQVTVTRAAPAPTEPTVSCPTVPSGDEGVCNLNEPQRGESGYATVAGGQIAQAFTTGAFTNYAVNAVSVNVAWLKGSSESFTASIHEVNGSAPGDQVGSAVGTFAATALGVVEFDTSGITLDGQTTYFLRIATDVTGAEMGFATTDSDDQTGSSGWSIANIRLLERGDGDWAGDPGNLQFAISATPSGPSLAPASTDATLSALTLTGITLVPTFDSATQTYTASVADDFLSTTVTATPTDTNAIVSAIELGGGATVNPVVLSVGANVITVTVTAEDGTTELVYTVTITRASEPSLCLTASGTQEGVCNFDFAGNDSDVTITGTGRSATSFTTGSEASYTLNTLRVNVTDPKAGSYTLAIYTDNGGVPGTEHAALTGPALAAGAQNFTGTSVTLDGSTTYWVVTTAGGASEIDFSGTDLTGETGDTGWAIGNGRQQYIASTSSWDAQPNILQFSVVATPAAPTLGADSGLSDLMLSGITLDRNFHTKTQEYTASVPNSVSMTTITATVSHAPASYEATVTAGGSINGNVVTLVVGENVITVTVTAENGVNMRTYTVTVTRADDTAFEPNNDNTDSRMYSLVVYAGAGTSGAVLPLTPAFDSATSSYSIPRPAAGETQVTVAFQTHSALTRSFDATVGSGVATSITGVSNGAGTHTYTLPLSAVNLTLTWEAGDGTSDGLQISVAAAPPPNAPQNLQVGALSTVISVGWEAPSGGTAPTGYEVCVVAAPTAISEVACTNAVSEFVSTLTHTRTGLTNGTTYNVGVRTHAGSAGSSDWVTGSATPNLPALSIAATQEGFFLDRDGARGAVFRVTRGQAIFGAAPTPAVTLTAAGGADLSVYFDTTSIAFDRDPASNAPTFSIVGGASAEVEVVFPLKTLTATELAAARDIQVTATLSAPGSGDGYRLGSEASATVTVGPESVKRLSALALAGLELMPAFNPGITAYTALADAESDITSTVVTATAEDASTTVRITYDGVAVTGGAVNLRVGANVIEIAIRGRGGSAGDYTVVVTREGASEEDLIEVGTTVVGALDVAGARLAAGLIAQRFNAAPAQSASSKLAALSAVRADEQRAAAYARAIGADASADAVGLGEAAGVAATGAGWGVESSSHEQAAPGSIESRYPRSTWRKVDGDALAHMARHRLSSLNLGLSGGYGLWTAAARADISGDPDVGQRTGYDGESDTVQFGLDRRSEDGGTLLGLAVGWNQSEAEFTQLAGEAGPALSGAVKRSGVTVYPYLSRRVTTSTSLWLLGGYGVGNYELTLDTGSEETDATQWVLAGGLESAYGKGHGLGVRTRLGGLLADSEVEAGDEFIPAFKTDSYQAQGEMELGYTGERLRPYLLGAVRVSGGDGFDTNLAVDIGAGLQGSFRALGLHFDVGGRGQVRERRSRQEHVLYGSLRYDAGGDGRGFTAALSQGMSQVLRSNWRTGEFGDVERAGSLNTGGLDARFGYGWGARLGQRAGVLTAFAELRGAAPSVGLLFEAPRFSLSLQTRDMQETPRTELRLETSF